MLPDVRLATLTGVALLFNLHYCLLGRPFLEGPLTSRPVLSLGNRLLGSIVAKGMVQAGVTPPDRTEVYDSKRRSRIDVYEPEEHSSLQEGPRTAVLYFHSGAFIAGHRSMGAGMCSWLASHGAVCFSASYRLTNSGDGVSGCIEDAWASLRWLRANAARLNIDPKKIVIAGDSAGGLLATALGTGLGADVPTGMGGQVLVDRATLPAAVIGGWPVTALGAKTYVPRLAADGEWEPTGAGQEFAVQNAFVPQKYGDSAEATQARLRSVLAGGLLCFGRRAFGLLPSAQRFPADDAATVSPLRRAASRSDLPPMLFLTGGADQIVPCDQTSRFADAARGAGNEVAQLIFEDAVHGGGGVNCAAGRQATLDFLRHNGLLTGPTREGDDPRDSIGGAMRAFKQQSVEYEYEPKGVPFRPAVHARSTLRLRPLIRK